MRTEKEMMDIILSFAKNDERVRVVAMEGSRLNKNAPKSADPLVYVRFLNNSVYIYKGVPQAQFEGLISAPSIGSYLHRNIKNLYPYEGIE